MKEDQTMDRTNKTNGDAANDRIDRDLLISRAIDEQASDDDWAQLRRLSETDATVWRDLAEAQHEHAELSRALEGAIAVADEIDAPVEHFVQTRFANRLRVVATWGGWAVAAVLVLAMVRNPNLSNEVTNTAGLAGPRLGEVTPDQALQRYIDEGRRTGQVLEEIPERVLIETRPVAGGDGVEVIFIRQFIERTRVHTLYRTGQDEYGRWISLPIEMKAKASDPL
jgi:hypothetical protein